MRSIQINYNSKDDILEKIEGKNEEDWVKVCKKYDDDVHRIKDIKDNEPFTALYECFDENNSTFYFLVEENTELFKLRRKNARNSLGME